MISVCIATYNGEKFIKNQLESILYQLSNDDEVIISDNCSSDKTVQIIESFKDKRIKLLIFEKKNIALNFENALNNSIGDIIFLADQDDVWLKGKVEVCLQGLETVDLVLTNAVIVDENLKKTNSSFFEYRKTTKGLLKNIYKNTYVGSCMAFRRCILKKALPFPGKIAMHDCWIGLVAELYGSITHIDQTFLLYRRHSNNASNSSVKTSNSIIKILSIRLWLIYYLSKLYFCSVFNKSDEAFPRDNN